MSLSKTLRSAEFWCGFEIVVALALLVASVVIVGDPGAQQDYQSAAQSAANEGGAVSPGDTNERIADYTYVLAWFTGALAVATVILCIATVLLWLETKQIRTDTRHAQRTLERAYVHVRIDKADPEGNFLKRPQVRYRATNHGKTPAYIGGIEGTLYLEGVGAGGRQSTDEAQLLRQTVLGADARTEWLTAEVTVIDLEAPMERYNAGEGTLRLRVAITYADIWENWYSEETWATFDRRRRRWNITRNEYPVIDGKVKYPPRE